MQLLKSKAEQVLGQDCGLCGSNSPNRLVCGECERSLPWNSGAGPEVAAFAYRFPVDRMIQRFKFAGDLAMGHWLALQLGVRAAGEARPDLLVAPPLTPARLRARGFNQALVVARVVGRRLGVPCAIDGIERTRDTPPQHLLGRRARRDNLRGAFRCDLRLGGARVAVVDDVLTTGATADALRAVLEDAGALKVDTWTIARTPPPGE